MTRAPNAGPTAKEVVSPTLATAAFLFRADLLGAWLPPDVSGSRSVLAHGWHGRLQVCGFRLVDLPTKGEA